MASVEFTDNSAQIKAILDAAAIAYLYEAGMELSAQVKRNTREDTGQLKGAWDYKVNEEKGECVVGNPLENAIWEEFGTGEYALGGNGRKGGWYIPAGKLSAKAKSKMKKVIGKDGKEYYFTKGKKPNRALQKSFNSLKTKLIKRAEETLKERIK